MPLQVGVSNVGQTLVATKTILLGQPAANPTLNGLLVNGQPPGDGELTIGKLVNVPLSIDASDVGFGVTWLTSCGIIHDFNLPQAYLRVETADL